jgi:hypothetical protein
MVLQPPAECRNGKSDKEESMKKITLSVLLGLVLVALLMASGAAYAEPDLQVSQAVASDIDATPAPAFLLVLDLVVVPEFAALDPGVAVIFCPLLATVDRTRSPSLNYQTDNYSQATGDRLLWRFDPTPAANHYGDDGQRGPLHQWIKA